MSQNLPLKVRAYIFRINSQNKVELLVFRQPAYPEAGTQVPGGTVDVGEELEQTLFREILEETGKIIEKNWEQVCTLALEKKSPPAIHSETAYMIRNHQELPDTWTHVVTGGGEDDGIEFHFQWINLEEANKTLWPWMVELLNHCLSKLERK